MNSHISFKNLRGNFVLDSYPVIVYLRQEPQAESVEELFNLSLSGKVTLWLNAINLAEILYKLTRRGANFDSLYQDIGKLPIRILDPDRNLILQAARLKAKYPIALADCFAAAEALKLKAPLITNDPEFKKIQNFTKIIWLD